MEDLMVLATTVWKEARNQPLLGQKAVAANIMNRVRKPQWPNSVPGVCFQRLQYSAWNSGDPNRFKMPDFKTPRDLRSFSKALEASVWALNNPEECKAFGDHYHTVNISPSWSDESKVVAVIKDHKFLNLYEEEEAD